MSKTITLREANRTFARCVREVEAAEYIITRNGRPVARLMPASGRRILSAGQQTARARARTRMEEGWPIGAGLLDRASLHKR